MGVQNWVNTWFLAETSIFLDSKQRNNCTSPWIGDLYIICFNPFQSWLVPWCIYFAHFLPLKLSYSNQKPLPPQEKKTPQIFASAARSCNIRATIPRFDVGIVAFLVAPEACGTSTRDFWLGKRFTPLVTNRRDLMFCCWSLSFEALKFCREKLLAIWQCIFTTGGDLKSNKFSQLTQYRQKNDIKTCMLRPFFCKRELLCNIFNPQIQKLRAARCLSRYPMEPPKP